MRQAEEKMTQKYRSRYQEHTTSNRLSQSTIHPFYFVSISFQLLLRCCDLFIRVDELFPQTKDDRGTLCLCVQTSQRCQRETVHPANMGDRPLWTRPCAGIERSTNEVVFWGNGVGWRWPHLPAPKININRLLPALGRFLRMCKGCR